MRCIFYPEEAPSAFLKEQLRYTYSFFLLLCILQPCIVFHEIISDWIMQASVSGKIKYRIFNYVFAEDTFIPVDYCFIRFVVSDIFVLICT